MGGSARPDQLCSAFLIQSPRRKTLSQTISSAPRWRTGNNQAWAAAGRDHRAGLRAAERDRRANRGGIAGFISVVPEVL